MGWGGDWGQASLTLGCKVEQGACDSKSKEGVQAGVGPKDHVL